MTQKQPGIFLVLDGTEGCGKSTQTALLANRLHAAGRDVINVRDPGTTRVGERIRALLLDPEHAEMGMRCEMLLYMAARAQMMAQAILPALSAGKTVICDRFVSSTLAYQLGGDGLTAAEIRSIAGVAIRGRWPDLTLLLDMPPAESFARVTRAKDRIERRPLEYHEQVRRNYLAQADADPAHYRVIPAGRPVDDVHADLWAAVAPLFGAALRGRDQRKPGITQRGLAAIGRQPKPNEVNAKTPRTPRSEEQDEALE